jgi:hypothetical protein
MPKPRSYKPFIYFGPQSAQMEGRTGSRRGLARAQALPWSGPGLLFDPSGPPVSAVAVDQRGGGPGSIQGPWHPK